MLSYAAERAVQGARLTGPGGPGAADPDNKVNRPKISSNRMIDTRNHALGVANALDGTVATNGHTKKTTHRWDEIERETTGAGELEGTGGSPPMRRGAKVAPDTDTLGDSCLGFLCPLSPLFSPLPYATD